MPRIYNAIQVFTEKPFNDININKVMDLGFIAKADALVVALEDKQLVVCLGLSLQAFETEVFGRPFAKIAVSDFAFQGYENRVTCLLAMLERANEWLNTKKVLCASFRCPEDRVDLIHSFEDMGYRFVENYLSFALDLNNNDKLIDATSIATRPFCKSDIKDLERIATCNLTTSRFHADPRLDPTKAALTRARWVSNACADPTKMVLVAEVDQAIVGFVIGKRDFLKGRETAVLDLIAVEYRFRGRGIGSALTLGLAHHYLGMADRLEVGTQGKNAAAIHMYQRCRFQFLSSEISLHKVFD